MHLQVDCSKLDGTLSLMASISAFGASGRQSQRSKKDNFSRTGETGIAGRNASPLRRIGEQARSWHISVRH